MRHLQYIYIYIDVIIVADSVSIYWDLIEQPLVEQNLRKYELRMPEIEKLKPI